MLLKAFVLVVFSFGSLESASISILNATDLGSSVPTQEEHQQQQQHNVSVDYNVTEGIDWVIKSPLNRTKLADLRKPANFSWSFGHNMTKDQVRSLQGQIMSSYMNLTADPCNDFYDYVCGNWQDHNEIPDDSMGFDTFEKLREELYIVLKQLLESEAIPEEGSAIAKAKILYDSCMDQESLEARKEKPLLDLLDQLGGWPLLSSDWNASQFDWVDLMARLRLFNNDIFVAVWVGPDSKKSDSYIVQLDQGDLGLPSREYYVLPSHAIVVNAYADLIRGAAYILGGRHQQVDPDVEEMIDFEKELAKILVPSEERRNFTSLYKKMTIEELEQRTPTIPWSKYLSVLQGQQPKMNDTIVVYAEDYLVLLAELIQKTKPRVVANYLMWRFIRHRLSNLDSRFNDLKQDLYAIVYGRRQQPERWKNCVSYVNGNMGMAVGSLFVRKYFSESSKNDTTQLTEEIQSVFQEMFQDVQWLDQETKTKARQKLYSMTLKIGYPDHIVIPEKLDAEFRGLEVQRGEFFENVLRILKFTSEEEFAKLHTLIDKTQWSTTPAVVNAYYSRNKNQIMLPAGILQPPFYHAHFPKALNYGGIGVVIGHEITHGFDDLGRQFDIRGNLEPWWPDEAISNFHSRTRCIIEQYNNYTVPEVQIPVNGVHTQGENIADNGGVRQAFKAYSNWIKSSGDSVNDEVIPGVNATAEQLFFINFGQIWCGATRPEAAASRIRNALHSPGRFRVVGSLSNLKEFTEAFKCPEGSPMNPANRCTVW